MYRRFCLEKVFGELRSYMRLTHTHALHRSSNIFQLKNLQDKHDRLSFILAVLRARWWHFRWERPGFSKDIRFGNSKLCLSKTHHLQICIWARQFSPSIVSRTFKSSHGLMLLAHDRDEPTIISCLQGRSRCGFRFAPCCDNGFEPKILAVQKSFSFF